MATLSASVGAVSCVAFTGSDHLACIGHSNGSCTVWDLRQRRRALHSLALHEEAVLSVEVQLCCQIARANGSWCSTERSHCTV